MPAAAEKNRLTDRWTAATLIRAQREYYFSKAWLNIVAAGRRSFKTEAGKRRLVKKTMAFSRFGDGRFFAAGPTRQQAKEIFWTDLKALTPTWALAGSRDSAISETELTIDYVNGARLRVVGLDKPERIEGKDWDGGVVTEFGSCKPKVFEEHILPMMSRGGWIDLEGVPEGRNHYYDLATAVQAQERGDAEAWKGSRFHTWTTDETLHLWLGKERASRWIETVQESVSTEVWLTEFKAQFRSALGRAYYSFSKDENLCPSGSRIEYDPDRDLILCFDFNASPGVCAYVQELDPEKSLPWMKRPSRRFPTVTAVIGEVFIRKNSNTRMVCEKIVADWKHVHDPHTRILLHGDATGGARKSQGVAGSDWDIVVETLKEGLPGVRIREDFPRANPSVRSRLNAFNSRLRSVDGSVGLAIDRKAARKFADDMEGCETDEKGDLKKEDGSPLTHLSDAVGYYLAEVAPIGGSTWSITR